MLVSWQAIYIRICNREQLHGTFSLGYSAIFVKSPSSIHHLIARPERLPVWCPKIDQIWHENNTSRTVLVQTQSPLFQEVQNQEETTLLSLSLRRLGLSCCHAYTIYINQSLVLPESHIDGERDEVRDGRSKQQKGGSVQWLPYHTVSRRTMQHLLAEL